MGQLDDIIAALSALPPEQRAVVEREVVERTSHLRWVPQPGPQTDAYYSEADELLFGGQAGGGKSDLIIGLSLTAHQRSLVLRRTNKEADKLFERYAEVVGNRDGANEQRGIWRIDDRIIDIGGCQLEIDKQKRKGIAHDLKAFDELVDFTRSQYEFIITWNRSTDPNQRCRIVASTNPPTRPEGMWVVERWAPWLDPKHPNPAKDGELRWFTNVDGVDTEVDGRGPHIINGKEVYAKSRTFIRSKLSDNAFLTRTDYQATLDRLPEELRLAYAEGKFDAGLKDAPFQVIPTDWIREAMHRWTPAPRPGVPMCAMGVDASGGGDDPMIIAPRYDGWYPVLTEIPGKDIPPLRQGAYCAGQVVSFRRNNAIVIVDMGGGYGGPTMEKLRENEIDCVAYKGAESSVGRTKDKQLGFWNKRSEVIWRFREALDPSQQGGSPIFLPDDPRLMADLAAPTFEVTPRGIKVEPKEDVCARLGRSTDRGDAVVMAWAAGPTYVDSGNIWLAKQKRSRTPQARAIMGRR